MRNRGTEYISILFALLITLTAGCATGPDYSQLSEQQLFEEALETLSRNDFTTAVEVLTQLEARFPFGRHTTQAKLDLIYAYYRADEFESAGAAAERFIRMYPDHANIDYAWYMKGLSSFTVDRGVLDRVMPSDYSEREMGLAQEAFQDFSTIVTRFPDSQYAPDARQRMVYLRNLLAKQQVQNAHYYLRRGAYVAAIRRASRLIQAFPESPYQGKALEIMARGYKALELKDLEETTLAVLRHNFPDYPALNSKGQLKSDPSLPAEERSLMNIATFGLLD